MTSASLTPREVATKYLDFLKKIAEFGPKMPQLTGHLQAAVAELRAAYDLAREHFSPTDGLKAVAINWDEVAANEPEILELENEVSASAGLSSSADGNKGIREVFMFLMQNPQLITMILSWFKS